MEQKSQSEINKITPVKSQKIKYDLDRTIQT